MRAAVSRGPGAIGVEEIDDPTPAAGEIAMEVRAVGVCHTDLHFHLGDTPIPFPVVLGHEGAGVVTAVGRGVDDVEVGDHVLCSIIASCGSCYYCVRGEVPLCEETQFFTGKMLDGTTRLSKGDEPIHTLHYQGSFAEQAIVPERFVTRIREDAPLDVVCGLACGVSTGMGAAVVRADVQPGSSVVVIGSGGVGLSAMVGARLRGATTVIAVDILQHKLDKAIELGLADHGLDSSTTDAVSAVMDLTAGRGADYAFDAVGVPGTLEMAIDAIRQGGTAVAIGRGSADLTATIDTSRFLRHKTVTGTFGGSITPRTHLPEWVDLYCEGKLPLDGILDARYTLDEVGTALEDLHHGRMTRGVIVP